MPQSLLDAFPRSRYNPAMPSTRDQIESWKARLLDLSRRNRLLHVRPGQAGTIALMQPAVGPLFDALVRHRRRMPFAAPLSLEQRLAALSWDQPATGATVRLDRVAAPAPLPGQLASDLPPEVQERVLYNMRLKARNALTEQGVNLLFVTLGMLEWFDPQAPEEVFRSPLLLLPVEIQRAPLGAEYAVRLIDDEIVLNPTLVHKLRHDLGLRLPELPPDSDDLQPEALFAQITELVGERLGWQVLPEATLGLFSFLKLLMYNDLQRAASAAEAHPILAQLAGEADRGPETRDTRHETLESSLMSQLDSRSPEQIFQVLDADASQGEAIATACAGTSFVLHGPPGTGKSQTIANIIAEVLAQGKRVLFVSEKMAALDVVYERLRACGLGEFCLELHSHKASKRTVLDALGASLDAPPVAAAPHFPYAELTAARDQLNGYARALHTPVGALGWTAYHVHGRIAALADAPDYEGPLVDVLTCSPEQMGAIDMLLAKLDARRELIGALATNPWRGSTSTTSSFEQRGRIRTALRTLLTLLAELQPAAAACAEQVGLPAPRSVGEARSLAALGALLRENSAVPTAWLEDESWTAASGRAALVADARDRYRALAEAEGRLFQRYQPAVLALDLDTLLNRFAEPYSSWLRVLRPQYHRDMETLRATLQPGATTDATYAVDDLRLAQDVRDRQRWEAESVPVLERFAPLFAGRATDWAALIATVGWTERLLALNLPRPLPPFLQVVANAPLAERADVLPDYDRLDAVLSRLDAEAPFLKTLFPNTDPRTQVDAWALATEDRGLKTGAADPMSPVSRFPSSVIGLRSVQLATLLDQMNGLDGWWEWCELRRSADPAGLGAFLDTLVASAVPATEPRRTFHKRFCQLWLDAAYDQLPALRSFQHDHHEALIAQFGRLDKAQLGAAQVALRRTLAARRPSPGAQGVPTSDLGMLRRELQKQRRHKPIRQLLREIPKLLGLLKPCLLMSPLSVSQFLDPEAISFDLVIFDEASQIRTEDAVGAIMRGKTLVVVGDNKQLPPTSFFMTADEEPESDDEIPVDQVEHFESVLDATVAAGLPTHMLRWHYRSRHEALITFSNANFYNGRLATFPVAKARPEMGVSFEYVPDALYDRQGTRANVVEARHVADVVCEHLLATPERSIGVVAFSQPQQLAILHELERRRSENEQLDRLFDEDRKNAVFVKNLENVQGDERDLMVISVGYGRDKAGRILMNFGPLNQQGGERRLNVAITRAREQVIVVSSILPEEIDLKRTQHPGPRLLRAYMEYARRGGPDPSGTLISPDGDPARLAPSQRPPAAVIAARVEDDLATALAQHGLALHRQVGHSDFRIDIAICDPANPSQYLLGVECDGADYRDAPTARDRDRLREEVLGGLGWRIQRAWSAAWARDAEGEVARILKALEDASQPQPSAAPDADTTSATPLPTPPAA